MVDTLTVPPEGQKPYTAYVSFSAEINTNTTESLIATFANLANQKITTVHLLISTPGGSVTNGINLYNVMRALPFKLVTHNVGNVDSIGNAIFLAGAERYACPHSTFMFHGVGFDEPAGIRLEEKLLRERLNLIDIEHNRMGSIIEERTKLDKEAISKLFLESQTKDATYAIGCGIVHQIKDVEIPVGCPIISLVFKR
jgi:ATP-dependent Clp protease, protease subunit